MGAVELSSSEVRFRIDATTNEIAELGRFSSILLQ